MKNGLSLLILYSLASYNATPGDISLVQKSYFGVKAMIIMGNGKEMDMDMRKVIKKSAQVGINN